MRAAGMQNGNSKLTPRKVQAVRDLVRAGLTHVEVAAAASLAPSTVSDISNRKLWRDLPDMPSAEVRGVRMIVVPTGLAGDADDDTVLLISGNTAHELVQVHVVLRRGPLTDEELSRG